MRFSSFFQNFQQFNQFNQFSQRPSLKKNLYSFFLSKSFTSRLASLLLSVWLLYYLTLAYMYLFAIPLKLGATNEGFNFFIKYIALNKNPEIAFSNPWQFAISPFLHTNFFHLVFNLLILSALTKLFFEFWSNLMLAFVLFTGIISSMIFFLYGNLVLPLDNLAVSELYYGFNAASYALMGFMLVFLFDYQFVYFLIIKVKLRYVILFFIIWDVFFNTNSQPILILSFVTAGLFGAILGLGIKFFPKLNSFKKPKFKVSYSKESTKNQSRPETDEMFLKRKKERQDKLDNILDKISKSGYSALTKEEKDFLFIESKKD